MISCGTDVTDCHVLIPKLDTLVRSKRQVERQVLDKSTEEGAGLQAR
jgi:hypothetical protein